MKSKDIHKPIHKRLFIIMSVIFVCLFIFLLLLHGIKAARFKKIVLTAQSNSVVQGDYRYYIPFTARNIEVRLFPEPVITANDAIKLYQNAYNFCENEAQKTGITASMDNPEFVEFAKLHLSFNESGDENFVKECNDFGKYLDYYEGIAINKKILNGLSSNSLWLWLNKNSVEAMMPVSATPTLSDNSGTPANN